MTLRLLKVTVLAISIGLLGGCAGGGGSGSGGDGSSGGDSKGKGSVKADPCSLTPTSPECEVLDLINSARLDEGLKPLDFNGKLANAAEGHNEYMLENGCFDHVCEGEKSLGARIRNAGYLFETAGETIGGGQETPEEIVQGWLDSPSHREILLGDYVEVGISRTDGTGGSEFGVYWTADFATPQ